MFKKKLKIEQNISKEIKEYVENNCIVVTCKHKKNSDELIKKFDYKISLLRTYNYSASEKRYIMCSYKLKDLIYKVLQVEAPIHIDECFERITKYLCIKSPKQYYFSYKNFLNQEIESGKIIEKNNFLYLKNTRIIIRKRYTHEYEVYCGKLNIYYIPPDEIIKLAKRVIGYSYSIDEEELARIVSQKIGFERMTKKISDVIFDTFELLKNDDEVCYKTGRYHYIPIMRINDIIKIAKEIIECRGSIQTADLFKEIKRKIGSNATKNTQNIIQESLRLLKDSKEIKYDFGNYSIQQSTEQNKQNVNYQKNKEQYSSLIDKMIDLLKSILFVE